MQATKDETAFWYYKSNVNPWSNAQSSVSEWTKYRDIEMELIEEAFQQGKLFVQLDRYQIDFERLIQVNLTDETKQRPVKREIGSNIQECLRENRFGSTIEVTSTAAVSSYGESGSWSPFLTAWLNSPPGKQAWLQFPLCIEACAQGIIREAALHGSHSNTEAAYMAEKIRQCLARPRQDASKVCINFYTKDSFLYSVLNIALREFDHSKLETLGPLCFIIRDYSRICQEFIGKVYRGADLKSVEIEMYKRAKGEWKTWPAYTSTSKDRETAEMFGNTLFIIEITDIQLCAARAYDIAHMSKYPGEKEVLIPAGICFHIVDVQQDPQKKYIIHIKV